MIQLSWLLLGLAVPGLVLELIAFRRLDLRLTLIGAAWALAFVLMAVGVLLAYIFAR